MHFFAFLFHVNYSTRYTCLFPFVPQRNIKLSVYENLSMRISRKIIVLCCSINGNEREAGNIIVTTIYILSRGRLINRIFKRRWNFYRFIFVFFFFYFSRLAQWMKQSCTQRQRVSLPKKAQNVGTVVHVLPPWTSLLKARQRKIKRNNEETNRNNEEIKIEKAQESKSNIVFESRNLSQENVVLLHFLVTWLRRVFDRKRMSSDTRTTRVFKVL